MYDLDLVHHEQPDKEMKIKLVVQYSDTNKNETRYTHDARAAIMWNVCNSNQPATEDPAWILRAES